MTEATGNRCASCHQQNLPAVAWATAAKKGVGYPEQIAQKQLKATVDASKRRGDTSIEQPPPVPSIAAWLLIGLDAADFPADPITDRFAYTLARYQHGDGRCHQHLQCLGNAGCKQADGAGKHHGDEVQGDLVAFELISVHGWPGFSD